MDARSMMTLDNGLRVVVQPTHHRTVYAELCVEHAAANERGGEEGIAHFLEHVLANGSSGRYSAESVTKLRQWLGYTNASTSRRFTKFICRALPADFAQWVDWMSDAVANPGFDAVTLEQERQRVLRELGDAVGKPDYLHNCAFDTELCRGAWPHEHLVVGDAGVIGATTADGLRRFHGRGYRAGNMSLVVTGMVDDDLGALIAQRFSSVPQGLGDPVEFEEIPGLERNVLLRYAAPDMLRSDDAQGSSALVRMGFLGTLVQCEDGGTVEVLDGILGGLQKTRLYRRISQSEGLAYGISSKWSGFNRDARWYIQGKISAGRVESAIDMVFDEMRLLQEELVGDEELDSVKHKLAYFRSKQHDSVEGLVSSIREELYHGIVNEEWMESVRLVTAKDVQAAAQRYLPVGRADGKYVLMVRDPLLK